MINSLHRQLFLDPESLAPVLSACCRVVLGVTVCASRPVFIVEYGPQATENVLREAEDKLKAIQHSVVTDRPSARC